MRVLVCGGRDFNDYERLKEILNYYWIPVRAIDVIIHGGAIGADTLAGKYAKENNIFVERYPADWDKYGKVAGPIRNKQMLDEGKPDLVIAFPGGKGTAHMVKIAKEANIKVVEIETN